jgi:hypothetical protein
MTSKFHQNRVVELSKARDFEGLANIITEFAESVDSSDFCQQAAKMAINISANMLQIVNLEIFDIRKYRASIQTILDAHTELKSLENIQYALVRTCLALSDPLEAIGIATKCEHPRLRLFSAILEYAGTKGDFALAKSVLEMAFARKLVPTESDFASLVQSMSNLSRIEFTTEMDILLSVMKNYFDVLSEPNLIQSIINAATTRSVFVDEKVEISPDGGICPITGLNMQKYDLSDEQLESMIDLTRRLSIEASKLRYGEDAVDEFSPIMSALSSCVPDVILDAANIAHINQNFSEGYFRFDQINDIYEHFNNLGKKCLIVIHSKWLNEKRDLRLFVSNELNPPKKKKKSPLPPLGSNTIEGRRIVPCEAETPIIANEGDFAIVRPVPVDLIEKWRKNGVLLEVPHGQNDDWFWLHVCLLSMRTARESGDPDREILLVSNDQMRDHSYRMHYPKFFDLFISRHVCQYKIQFGEDCINHYEYLMPVPFSISIQSQKKGSKTVWHVPYAKDGSVRWLVVSF